MHRLRRALARRLRAAADILDPPGVVTVRLEADTTAFREAMAHAREQWRTTAVRRAGGGA